MTANRPLAIVIGQGGYNDMGLIRSCGQCGMDVIMIAPGDIIMPLAKSRYVKQWIQADVTSSWDISNVIKGIASTHKDREIILFPASDLSACLIDDNYKALSSMAIAPHANGNLRTLMDKATMVNIAQKSNLSVPESVMLDLASSDLTSFATPPLPCIIKPLRSIAGQKGDITVCRDISSVNKTFDIYRSKGFNEILVQSLIEGDNQEEIAVTGVSDGKGSVITHGTIHKRRIRGNGSTVFAKYSAQADEFLQHNVKTFIKHTGFSGIFDMEFIHNDTGYHFIECNFRNGAYGYAITSAGFNMPETFYLLSTGLPINDISVRDIVFMEERSDILNVLDHTITSIQWLKDVISTDTFLWWNKHDPAPMLRIPTFLRRLFKR